MKSAFVGHLLSLGVTITSLSVPSAPVVDLGYAKFKGTVNSTWGAITYFGLRYASPPVGHWRFRAPQPIEAGSYYNASSVVDATQQSNECIQAAAGSEITPTTPDVQPGSEDCLLADIIVPNIPTSPSLPVLVQIHGGGYAAGNSEFFPGYALVNQSQSIVYVSIQYRLNAFGFLSSPEILTNGDTNAGLLDQRAALDWVQRNIRHFGGDAQKVTISGGSAGGGSVTNQLILHGGEVHPPYRAAIAEYPWWQPYHNDTILALQYQEVLIATNCTDLECLRAAPSDVLNAASQRAQKTGFKRPRLYGYGDYCWGPSVDGVHILDLPSREFRQGRFTKVPLLVDHDQYEGFIFSNQSETTVREETADLKELFPYATDDFFTQLYALYPPTSFNSTFFQRQQIFGDFIIDCPTWYVADAMSRSGLPTWKMVFDAGTQKHGATEGYLYNTQKVENAALGEAMKDWFLAFVIHGDPNARGFTRAERPYWPRYRSPGLDHAVMNVQDRKFVVQEDADVSPQCRFFHEHSAVVRN
ncbi:alpha/beta-hydrolase [Myriangium duriaei CBS 260.36]|uniref:Carboxylic ester hydrolase n=1 Tax=Myriangium duriaei CBS 260.36 TaxID=1168546 RepID=A0A9P4MNR4_9PEZI|nr:alpha/beta-hydrolase [Myriangium duriaei CBS 260.36]